MNSIEIKDWHKDPDLAAIVKATFPGYKRKKIYVRATETITLTDLNWSGGTRSEYRTCYLTGAPAGNVDHYHQCAPWNNPAEGKTLPIPQGFVAVRGGHFCGKQSVLSIHVNPADMPKLITA